MVRTRGAYERLLDPAQAGKPVALAIDARVQAAMESELGRGSTFHFTARFRLAENLQLAPPPSTEELRLITASAAAAAAKAGAKIGPDNIEVKWEGYTDSAYYKLSIYADTATGAETNYDYINNHNYNSISWWL